MSRVLVDSNVILDVLTESEEWFEWSAGALARCADEGELAVNPVVYAEVSIRFERIEELEDALAPGQFLRLALPWGAVFLAGKCFLAYRLRGGVRRSALPDLLIGAHAAVSLLPLGNSENARQAVSG